ncbi:FAD-dependent oxidoreductase [Defluviitalea phaphyphila]|uniref:FAD-dependent oxidoreductase n=1 Tax=Defluviitalea phaphyphila TaxID=1473580 RepID=UPI0007301532|nr:FAD-dependent oxidoreductase [Defluviitalea phaphyphila]
MTRKILVVGGVAGGASAAARIRRLDESAEIIMFEKGPHVSFSNCCLPNHLSGMISESEDLVLMTPEIFKKRFNIEARVNNEVIKINRDKKTIIVKDLITKKEYEEAYDKLILSPGANPVIPKVEGCNKPHVFTIRNVVDIDKLNKYVKNNNIKDIAVIGGGFIGVEIVENLKLANLDFNITLIEASNQIMDTLDYDMVQILHKEMIDKGINLILEDSVIKINDDNIKLFSGKEIPAQAVIIAIGVKPETKLAKEAGLEIGETGGIKVDHNYLTSDKDIYAVGDAIEVYHKITKTKTRLPLAGPAQRQARAAADHMYGIPHRNTGVIGSSCVKLFDLNVASTGLTEKDAKNAGIPYDFVYIIPGDIVGIMPDNSPLHFKLIYEVPTGKILGAQAVGKGNATKRIDVIATMIMMNGTLEDLKELELCYAPAFNTAKDPVNYAALVGLNLLNGVFKQVPVYKVRELVENNAFIIDVRERKEYEAGHLINAINIPLSELRERISEIPKDRPVYLHCRSSQRSYYAIMALQNMGFDNLYNISGSYLGICLYEYYNDKITGRKKIVTKYNFK